MDGTKQRYCYLNSSSFLREVPTGPSVSSQILISNNTSNCRFPFKPSELAFFILLHKNLITTYCIDSIKARARGIGNPTSVDSEQSFP